MYWLKKIGVDILFVVFSVVLILIIFWVSSNYMQDILEREIINDDTAIIGGIVALASAGLVILIEITKYLWDYVHKHVEDADIIKILKCLEDTSIEIEAITQCPEISGLPDHIIERLLLKLVMMHIVKITYDHNKGQMVYVLRE